MMSEGALTPVFPDELRRERLALATVERHLCAGKDRLSRQQKLISYRQEGGREHCEGVRYLDLLRSTMQEWERHHQLIVERVHYLEGK
jgi:hypothetical protein